MDNKCQLRKYTNEPNQSVVFNSILLCPMVATYEVEHFQLKPK